jgi:hypothetical protein
MAIIHHHPQCTKLLTAILICFLSLAASFARAETAPEQRAREILAKIDDLWRADSSHGILAMQVKTEHYTRTVRMESWTKGRDYSLVRILAPIKELGTATLKAGNNIYTYLPKTDRTIRLTSGMMMGSWMGSHFTNDDLVKESRLADDYQPVITFEGLKDGEAVLEFTLHPHEDAPVVWSRIVITIRAEDYLPLQSLYYDEDQALVRTLRFEKIKELGGRQLPTVMRMVPEENPTEYTELVYESLDFDIALADSFFSLIELRRK